MGCRGAPSEDTGCAQQTPIKSNKCKMVFGGPQNIVSVVTLSAVSLTGVALRLEADHSNCNLIYEDG